MRVQNAMLESRELANLLFGKCCHLRRNDLRSD